MPAEEKKKNIIVYVMSIPGGAAESIHEWGKREKTNYRVMLLWDAKVKFDPDKAKDADLVVSCNFSKPSSIAKALLPYQEELLAITCRSEPNIERFAQVLPHVPYLHSPTVESLRWASDKYLMRQRFKMYNPKITPEFTLVMKNTKEERERIVSKIGFPLIIKPANLSGSLLVSVCYHEEELEKTLSTAFRKIRKAYKNDNRLEEPRLVAEGFMEGDMYSIDSYVNSRGKVVHCPLVKVVTGKKVGHDSFQGYLQITPPLFKKTTVAKAEEVAEAAIHALGLRSSIAHTELMKIDDEWKVVEIGARMGGFRHLLYKLTCDIDHSLNDVLVRIPKAPVIPKKCHSYACAMKWFAHKEGTIKEMRGVKKIEALESFYSIAINKKIGDRAVFAQNGGRSVFNLIMRNSDRSKLLADIRRVEQMVKIVVG